MAQHFQYFFNGPLDEDGKPEKPVEFDATREDAHAIFEAMVSYWSGDEVCFGFTEGPWWQGEADSEFSRNALEEFKQHG